MAGVEIEDLTGKPEDVHQYQECIETVTKFMGVAWMMKLPPELAVLMPQIRRCLMQGQKLTEHLERSIVASRQHTESLPTPGVTGAIESEEGYGICNSCRGTTPMPGPCRYCGHTN